MGESSGRVAIVLHIACLSAADRMLSQLSWLTNREDAYVLWITMSISMRANVQSLLVRHGLAAKVRVHDSLVMDVVPFLRLLPELVEHRCPVVVNLYAMRGEGVARVQWGSSLVDRMCRELVLDGVSRVLEHNSELKMLGLAPFFLSARRLGADNEQKINALIKEIRGLTAPVGDWGYFSGNVFAARTELLIPLVRWAKDNMNWLEFKYQKDERWSEAVESVFGLMAGQPGACIGLLHDGPDPNQFVLQRVRPGEGINQAHRRDLEAQLETLALDCEYMAQGDLMIKNDYALEGDVLGEIDLHRHYLLIGQFDHRRFASKPWQLKRYNECTLPWDRWRNEARELELVSVIIPVFNQPILVERCIRALFSAETEVCFEVVCVDNGSGPATRAMLASLTREFSALHLVRNETNLNFALGCNIGFGQSRGRRVVFLNSDTIVTDSWLDRLVARLDDGDCFGVQPQLRYPDGTLQCMGVVFSEKSPLGYPIYADMTPSDCKAGKPRKFKALTAACIGLLAEDFIRAQGFDAIFINGQEDVDLCLRLHQMTGKLGAYEPSSVVIHLESKSEGRFKCVDQNRKIFVKRWGGHVIPDDLTYYRDDGFTVTGWRSDCGVRDERLKIFRPTLESVSLISSANTALRAGDYSSAARSYIELAFARRPAFPGLEGNLEALRSRWLLERNKGAKRPRVGVLSFSLNPSPVGRVMTLAAAYGPHAEVEVIGDIAPKFKTELRAALKDRGVSIHDFTVMPGSQFVRQALELVALHPFDVVHLSNPEIHNVMFGSLYQLVWGARVIMDVSDKEFVRLELESPLNLLEYIGARGSPPTLESVGGRTWGRLPADITKQFDGVTTSSSILQKQYGGYILPPVSLASSYEKRLASRKTFGIPVHKRVVLFCGRQGMHQWMNETARLFAEFGWTDFCCVMTGAEPNPVFDTVYGVDLICLGPQPDDRMRDVITLSDVCVFLPNSGLHAAQCQLPAMLTVALRMGVTVFSQVTPALDGLVIEGAFIPVTEETLMQKLRKYFEDCHEGEVKRRAVLEGEQAVDAVSPIIGNILSDKSPRRAKSVSWVGQLSRLLKGELPKGVPMVAE